MKLINKFLKAGIIENGVVEATELGISQGSIISATLANIYLI
ncbi:hypothetical protein GCM10008905_07250 [Clostridium malenominatum]|uniref:Uncharacterized protein n=1 Tax=Clostridium malenominatum TaxID=1539 RepID=A0ABN1IR10_9CLOT